MIEKTLYRSAAVILESGGSENANDQAERRHNGRSEPGPHFLGDARESPCDRLKHDESETEPGATEPDFRDYVARPFEIDPAIALRIVAHGIRNPNELLVRMSRYSTVITTLPRSCPSSRYRIASGPSLN